MTVDSILAEALKHRGEYPVHDRIEPERYRLAADIRRALNDAGYTVARADVDGLAYDIAAYIEKNRADYDAWRAGDKAEAPPTLYYPPTIDYLSASEQRRLACPCGCRLRDHTEVGCGPHGAHSFTRTSEAGPTPK